jgi:hypothetical protein
MNWNPRARPQHNGKVERCNGVTQRWAEPSRCQSRSEVQDRLDHECLIQREHYPSIGGRSRIEAFPDLKKKGRFYHPDVEDDLWELSRVDRFLAGQILYRVANERGAIWLYGKGRVVGRPHRGQEIRARFDSVTRHWIATDDQGRELKRLPAIELTRERIIALNVGAKRPRSTRVRGEG